MKMSAAATKLAEKGWLTGGKAPQVAATTQFLGFVAVGPAPKIGAASNLDIPNPGQPHQPNVGLPWLHMCCVGLAD